MTADRMRAPKPDWKTSGERIAKRKKLRILEEYEKGRGKDKTSDDVLESLGRKYKRSPRQIQRYINEARSYTTVVQQSSESHTDESLSKQTDITHTEDMEEHWENVEFLIEKWEEQNHKAGIPTISQSLKGSVKPYSYYFDLDMLFLPLEGTRVYINSLREHLGNYPNLWEYHAARIKEFKVYEKLCNNFAHEIRGERRNWANVSFEDGFEQPIFILADCKLFALSIPPSEDEESFSLPETNEISWSASQRKLIATFPERIRGMLGPQNMQLGFTVLQADNPLLCVQLYESMCSRLLNGETVKNIIQMHIELRDLRIKIAETFAEISMRRDYKAVTCSYCPIQ